MEKMQMLLDEINKQISQSPYKCYINFKSDMLKAKDDKNFFINCADLAIRSPFSPVVISTTMVQMFKKPDYIKDVTAINGYIYFTTA